jgi:hypothetical protein
VIANEVFCSVRNAMKGQPELQVERAVLQARREADVLSNLAVGANVEVIETALQREREYILLLRLLSAEIRGKASKDRVETLRLAFLMAIEPVIILDAAITQIAAERLIGQPVLFRDTAAKLEEQLKMVTDLTTWFNEAAVKVASTQIDLEEVRDNLQSEIDRQISIWVHLARTVALSLFGTEKEIDAAMEQSYRLFKPNCCEASDNVDA